MEGYLRTVKHTEVLVAQALVTEEQVVWYFLGGVRQNVKSGVLTCDPNKRKIVDE